MWTRRQFLSRGVGSAVGLGAAGLAWKAYCGDGPTDGSQSRGMITRAAQEAIDRGLAYLDQSQNVDGSFGTDQHRGNVAISSLGGLAFMAGGHQPGRGRYGRNVQRALEYVLAQERPQERAGYLFNRETQLHGPMYGHGFGTLFLAEAHGMVQDRALRDRLRGTLERATKLIIDTQNAQGGWRYHPQPVEADISVTICQIMALRAARNAGVAVPKATADKCISYVKSCQDAINTGGFRYMPQSGTAGFARTAAGVVALHSAGMYKGANVDKGLDFLMRNCKPGQARAEQRGDIAMHYYYGHYYAVQAMWTAGGRYWTEWYPAVREELLAHADRRDNGSWSDGRICPHYCTAMALIILQVPNNYLPILQR